MNSYYIPEFPEDDGNFYQQQLEQEEENETDRSSISKGSNSIRASVKDTHESGLPF
jgi:hypothetical protein